MGGDTSDGGAGDTDPVEPPHFDIGNVPDAPSNSPPDIGAWLVAEGEYLLAYGSADSLVGILDHWEGPLVDDQCPAGMTSVLIPGWTEYIYLVAYADAQGPQGVLGLLERVGGFYGPVPPLWSPDPLLTGDPAWEVCATGLDYDPGDDPPNLALIEAQIEQCNLQTSDPQTTSHGWVDQEGTEYGAMAAGELNDTPLDVEPQPGNEFPLRCADVLPPETQWMWFNWDPENISWPTQSPFLHPGGDDNPTHEFLIFRVRNKDIPY
ncbi:MAG: hypothetical protein AAF799_15130 [Myxococcota bacterium]